jgi:hypothetical protein
MAFDDFFTRLTTFPRHDWQARLALDSVCRPNAKLLSTGLARYVLWAQSSTDGTELSVPAHGRRTDRLVVGEVLA